MKLELSNSLDSKDLLQQGKFFSTIDSKNFFYLIQDVGNLKDHMYLDWKLFLNGINRSKLDHNEKHTHKLLKYLHLINDFFHLYETFYSTMLNEDLNGKEKNEDKLNLLFERYKIEKNGKMYYNMLFLNKACSEFRNKISHGSILSVAIKFALSNTESHMQEFKDFMNSAEKITVYTKHVSTFHLDKFNLIKKDINRCMNINLNKSLKKTSINVKINNTEIIEQINKRIANNNNIIQKNNERILKMKNKKNLVKKVKEFKEIIYGLKRENKNLSECVVNFSYFYLDLHSLFNLLFETIMIIQEKINYKTAFKEN